MSMLIIGSSAMRYNFPSFAREPKDLDVFGVDPLFPGDEKTDSFYDARLDPFLPATLRFATPDELYTIKVSHAYWELANGSWSKHMADMLFLQDNGAVILEDFYKVLYQVWVDRHGTKKMDLTKEANDFFRDAVKRIYDHDSLHRSLALTPGKPIYEDFLKPDHSVDMDMAKVWAAPKQTVVDMFREEIAATALERIVVPRNYKGSPGAAWTWALRRCITSLMRGKSARFMVENFRDFMTPDNYIQRHLNNKEMLIKLEEN